MKLFSILSFFVILCQEQCFSRGLRTSRGLQKAFSEIVQSLAAREHVVTIFNFKTESETSDSAPFASIAPIPHVAARIPNKLIQFKLSSSAIVSLESIDSLKTFRKAVYLSTFFSMSKQVFIHFQKGIFDDLKKLKRLVMSETDYFLIEEDSTIRLVTFVLFTSVKCYE